MKHIDISTLPRVKFAHKHSADTYDFSLSSRIKGIEVCYVSDGCLTLKKDGEVFTAEKGDIICLIHDSDVLIFSDTFHSHNTVYADVSYIFSDSPNGFYLPLLTKASPETEKITKMIDDFIYKPYRYESAVSKSSTEFMNILYNIDAINLSNQDKASEKNLLVAKAKKYIYKNIHRNILQSEIADHLNITPQYLCNIFKQSEGVSLIKYVNTVKLRQIQTLMEKENLRLYEAAQLFGFSDPNYVSHLYKKTFGRNITSKPDLSDITG